MKSKLIALVLSVSVLIGCSSAVAQVTNEAGAVIPPLALATNGNQIVLTTGALNSVETGGTGAVQISPDLIELMKFVQTVLPASWVPHFAAIALIMTGLRLVMKPAFSLWHSIQDARGKPTNDALIEKIDNSKTLSILSYLADWFGSVKVVRKPTVETPKLPEQQTP